MNEILTPLDDDEFSELAEFLVSDKVPDTTMSVVMLDGFLTAIASGPGDKAPARWLPWIWDFERGRDAPDLPARQARRIAGLVTRHLNGIAMAFAEEPESFEPLFATDENEEGDEFEVPDEWCAGFLAGMALDEPEWQPLMAAHPQWFASLRLYGTEEGHRTLEADPQAAGDAHEDRLDDIIDSVRRIHMHWLEQRGGQPVAAHVAQPATARREGAKVGRNDPCPCGSGRKFKQCHGAS